MNEQKLSQRLQTVANQVPKNARLADIGSDHAYLPAWLVLQNKLSFAVAGEVVKGPFDSARSLVESLGLTDKISVRMADGLEVLNETDRIDTITIAGMGGTLIRDILQRGKTKGHLFGKERLVLQPNVGEATLRKWLMDESYKLLHEEILEEDQKIYEVIVAEKSTEKMTYTEKELFFGPILMAKPNEIWQKKWQQQLKKYQYVLESLEKASEPAEAKIKETQEKINWIKEMLD